VSPQARRVWRRVATGVSTVLLIGAIGLAALMILPSLLGYERYVIVSGSMEPTIPVGSIVYDEVVPVDDLEVGDIITFVPPAEFDISDPVTHRIHSITVGGEDSDVPGQRVFRTKGDNNDNVDPWHMVLDRPEQARVAHHIPYVGYVYMALSKPWVQLLLIGLPALAIAVFVVLSLWRISGQAVMEERREKSEADTAPTADAGAAR
jgi:signal peptidase